MDNLLFKSGNNGQVNVDQALGIVECFVAGIGNKDSVGDVVISGAFAKSLTHRKPRVVWGHSWNDPIGKVLEMYEVPIGDSRLPAKMRNAGIGGLYAKVQFNLQSEKGKEAFATVAFFGEDQEWSIGYKTIDSIFDPNLQANILKEVELYEVSPVLHGANQLTGTISIKTDEKSHMPIIPIQGEGMPMMGQMPRIVVVAASNDQQDESSTDNPFAEGMSRELSQPDKNALQTELTERTGSKIEVMNATENIVVFRRTTSDGKASMYRLPYHNEGGQFMFGKPEPYEVETSVPQPMQNIEQKPGVPVVVPNGGIAYRNDDQQEMMNLFGNTVESPFGKSEISHLIELPESYMMGAKDFVNPVLRHHKLAGRPSAKGIIIDGVLTASALDALQNAVKALGSTLGQVSGNIGQAIGKIRDLAQTFNPYALDGDGDGFVQDGSAFQRPYIPIKKPGFDLPDVRGRKRSGDALLDKPQLTSGGLPKDKNKWTPEQRKEALLGGLIEPETREDVAFLANKRPTNEGLAKYWDMSEADLTKEGNRLINARKQSAGADKERIDQELLKVSHDFQRRASYAETFGQEFVPPAKREMPNADLVPVDITENESIRRMLGAPKSNIPRTDEGFASRYDKYTDMFDTLVEQTEIDPSTEWSKLDEDSRIEFIKELDYDYMYDVHGNLGDDGIVEAMESGDYDDEIAEFAEDVWNTISKEKKLTADKERRLLDQEESEDPRNIADAEEAARIEREELEEERTERFRPTMAELAMEAEADDEIDGALERYVGELPFSDDEDGFASRGEPPIDPPDPELSDEFIEDYLTDNLSMGELDFETLEKYNNSDVNPLQRAVILDMYERYTSEDPAVSAEAVDEILKRFYTELVDDNYDSMVEAKNYRPDYGDDGFASRGEPFGFASRDDDGEIKQSKLDEMVEDVKTKLIAELETADPSTWKPSWRNDTLPVNPTTGKPYRGFNAFWLMMRTKGENYSTGRFAGFNQLKARGAQVRKGEKGVPILRPQLVKKEDKDGNVKEFVVFRGSTVFNIDQTDGGDEALRSIPADLPEEQRIKILEATIAELGVSVKTDNMSGPHYSPTGDYVSMPDFSKGTSALEWNSSLAHETIHWTGGASRLNRPSVANYSDSKQTRAYEELVAEIGSAMFLAAHGIDAPFREDHAPYIKGWISLLKDDPDALSRAFKDATAAINHILEKSPNLRKLFGGTDSGKKAPEVDAPDLVGAAVSSSEGFASLHRVRTPRSEALTGILYDDNSGDLMVGFQKGKPWDKLSGDEQDNWVEKVYEQARKGNEQFGLGGLDPEDLIYFRNRAKDMYDDSRDTGWYVYSDVSMPEVEELATVRSKGKHINALKKLKKARKATDEDQFNFFGRDEKMQDVVSSKMNDGFASRGPKEPQEGLRRHKLMPAEIRGKIPKLDTTEEVPTDEKVLAVKFFSPYSDWTWYGVEFDGEDMFFGYVEGFEKEWGYFSLDELAKTQLGGMVPAVERDTSFRPTKFGDLNKADGFASTGSKRLGVEPNYADPTWVDKTQRRILRQNTDWGSLSHDDQIDWANSFLQEFIQENEMGHNLTDLMNGRRLNSRPDIGLINYAESAYARMSDSHARRRAQFGERPDGESDGFASVGSRTRRLGMQPSEAVDFVAYDPESESLFVAYKREDGRGDMYVYEGVSMDDAVALESAPSAGRAINDIKRRKDVRKATPEEVVGLSESETAEGNASKKAKTFKLIDDIYSNPEHRANRDIQLEINADRISVEDDGTVTWESNDNTRRYTISPRNDGRYLVTSEKLSRGGREEPDTFDTVSYTVEDSRENAIASLIETAKSKIADDVLESRLDRELADATRELDMAGDVPGVESIDVTYSTALDAVDYNPATKEMRITYKDSGTYIYEGVDADEVDAFKSAPSKGRATNDIKRGHPFRRDSEWSDGGDDDGGIEEFDVSGSEAVEQVSYDPEKEDLMVIYTGGKGYVYSGVTREEADALRSAPSKGRAINDVKRTHEVRMLTGEDVRFFGSKKMGELTPSEIQDDEEVTDADISGMSREEYSRDELRSFIDEQEGLLEVMDLNGESAEKLAQQRKIIDKAKRDLLASDPAPVAAPKMPTSKPPRGGKRVRNRSVAIEMEQGTLDEIIDAEKQGITVDELRAAAGGKGGKYTKGPRKGKYRGPDTITVRDSETGELLHSNEILLTSSASPGTPSSANRKRGYIRARSYVGRQGHTTTKDEGPSLRGDGKGMTNYDKRVYGLGSDEKNRDAGLASSGGRVRERGNRIGEDINDFRRYLDSEYGEYFMEYTQMDDEELKQTLMTRYRMSRGEARDLARQIRRDEKYYYDLWEQEDLRLNDLDALGYDGDVDGFASFMRDRNPNPPEESEPLVSYAGGVGDPTYVDELSGFVVDEINDDSRTFRWIRERIATEYLPNAKPGSEEFGILKGIADGEGISYEDYEKLPEKLLDDIDEFAGATGEYADFLIERERNNRPDGFASRGGQQLVPEKYLPYGNYDKNDLLGFLFNEDDNLDPDEAELIANFWANSDNVWDKYLEDAISNADGDISISRALPDAARNAYEDYLSASADRLEDNRLDGFASRGPTRLRFMELNKTEDWSDLSEAEQQEWIAELELDGAFELGATPKEMGDIAQDAWDERAARQKAFVTNEIMKTLSVLQEGLKGEPDKLRDVNLIDGPAFIAIEEMIDNPLEADSTDYREALKLLDDLRNRVNNYLDRRSQGNDEDGFASRGGRMAASKEQVDKLQNAIASLDTQERRARYLRGDYPRSENTQDLDVRYAFDMFWEAVDAGDLDYSDFENLNDAKLRTAMRNVVPKLVRSEDDGFASRGPEAQRAYDDVLGELELRDNTFGDLTDDEREAIASYWAESDALWDDYIDDQIADAEGDIDFARALAAQKLYEDYLDASADGFASRGSNIDTDKGRLNWLKGRIQRDVRQGRTSSSDFGSLDGLSDSELRDRIDGGDFDSYFDAISNSDGFASMGQELQDLQSKIQRELINPGSRNGKRNKPIDPDVAANLANPESDAGTLVYPSTDGGDSIRVSYNPEKRKYRVERIEPFEGEGVVVDTADADTSYEAGSLVREFAENYVNDLRSYENNDGRTATYESTFSRGGDADGFASSGGRRSIDEMREEFYAIAGSYDLDDPSDIIKARERLITARNKMGLEMMRANGIDPSKVRDIDDVVLDDQNDEYYLLDEYSSEINELDERLNQLRNQKEVADAKMQTASRVESEIDELSESVDQYLTDGEQNEKEALEAAIDEIDMFLDDETSDDEFDEVTQSHDDLLYSDQREKYEELKEKLKTISPDPDDDPVRNREVRREVARGLVGLMYELKANADDNFRKYEAIFDYETPYVDDESDLMSDRFNPNMKLNAPKTDSDGFASSGGKTRKADLTAISLRPGNLLPNYFPTRGGYENLMKRRERDPNYEMPPVSEVLAVAPMKGNPSKLIVTTKNIETGAYRNFEINKNAKLRDVRIPINRNNNEDGFASMYPKDEVGLEQFINQQEIELEDYAAASKLEPMKYPPSGLESTKKRIATAKRDLARIQKNKPKQEEEEFLESIDGFASRGAPNLNNMGFGPMDNEYWTTSDRGGRKTWEGTDAERGTTWTIQMTDQFDYEVSGSFDNGFGDEEVIDFGTEESYDDLEGAKRFVESFEVDDDDFQPSDSDIFTEQEMMDDFRDSDDGFASLMPTRPKREEERDAELADGMVASEIASNFARLSKDDQKMYFQRALANNADSGMTTDQILNEAQKLAMDDRGMAQLERQAVGMGGSSKPRKIDVSSSSALNYVAYDEMNRSLDVEYRGRDGKGTGTLYRYQDVEPDVVDRIEGSDSRGATVRELRDNYEFTTSRRLPDSAYEGLASRGEDYSLTWDELTKEDQFFVAQEYFERRGGPRPGARDFDLSAAQEYYESNPDVWAFPVSEDGFASRGRGRQGRRGQRMAPVSRYSAEDRQALADGNILRSRKRPGKRRQGPSASEFDGFASRTVDELPDTDVPFSRVPFEGGEHGPGKDFSLKKMWENYEKISKERGRGSKNDRWLSPDVSIEETAKFFGVDKNVAAKILQARDSRSPELFIDDPYLAQKINDKLGPDRETLFGFDPSAFYDDKGNLLSDVTTDQDLEDAVEMERARRAARIAAREGRKVGKSNLIKGGATIKDLEDALRQINPDIKLTNDDGGPLSPGAMKKAIEALGIEIPWSAETYRKIQREGGALSPNMIQYLVNRDILDPSFAKTEDMTIGQALQWPGFARFSGPQMIEALSDALGLSREEVAKARRSIDEALTNARKKQRQTIRQANIQRSSLKLTKEKIAKMIESLGLSVEDFEKWRSAPIPQK